MENENLTAKEVPEIGKIVHDKFDEGVRFIVMRGPASWCAYVGVPNGHPLAGHSYDDLSIDCHGGLTFASEGGKQNWPAGYYWYGWDYSHAGDISVYDYDPRIREDGPNRSYHDWTLGEVIKDSWGAIYDFKKLMLLSEEIKNKP